MTTYLCLPVFLPVNKDDAVFVQPMLLCHELPSKLSTPTVNNKFIGSGRLQERKLLCMARNKSGAKQWFLL